MKNIYAVVGELEDTDEISAFDGAYTTEELAQERCDFRAQNHDGYIWYPVEIPLYEEGDL